MWLSIHLPKEQRFDVGVMAMIRGLRVKVAAKVWDMASVRVRLPGLVYFLEQFGNGHVI